MVQAIVYAADLNDWVKSSPGRGAVTPAIDKKNRATLLLIVDSIKDTF